MIAILSSRFYPSRTNNRKPANCCTLKDIRYPLARAAQLSGLETDQILKPGKQVARVYA